MLQFRPIVTEDLELLLDLIPPIDPDPDVVDWTARQLRKWTARQLRKCVSIGPSASVGFGNHHFSNFARTVVENNRVVGCVTCSLLAPDFLDEIAEARSKERWYDISMRPSLKDEEFEGPLDLLLTSCFWKTGEGGVPDLQFLETALQRFTRYFEGIHSVLRRQSNWARSRHRYHQVCASDSRGEIRRSCRRLLHRSSHWGPSPPHRNRPMEGFGNLR